MIHKASLSKNLKKTSKGKSEKLIMHIDMDSFFCVRRIKGPARVEGEANCSVPCLKRCVIYLISHVKLDSARKR